MLDLNFHHLKYFWAAAREGSVTGASKRLGVSASTVSTQIKTLEESIGQDLFERKGRTMTLTAHGHVVQRYADDIFSLGEEMIDAVRGLDGPRHAQRIRIGVASYLPKTVAYRLLKPLLHLPDRPIHLVCTGDTADRLVADLTVNQLDVVLSDTPVGLASEVRLHSQLLGECEVSFMGTSRLRRRLANGFPDSLDGAPMLLPDRASSMRQLLEEWFANSGLRPSVVAELGDSALMKSFGSEGAGLFPIPSVVEKEVAAQYGVVEVGRLPGVRERFYAVSTPGRLDAFPLNAIVEAAEHTLDPLRVTDDAA